MKELPSSKDHPFIFIQLLSLSIYSLLRSPPPPSRSSNRTCISVKCHQSLFPCRALCSCFFFFSVLILAQLPSVWIVMKKERERIYRLQWRVSLIHQHFSFKKLCHWQFSQYIHSSIGTPNYVHSPNIWCFCLGIIHRHTIHQPLKD